MEKKQKLCFTIGHSDHSIETFLKLLKKRKIGYLIDIRSKPYSKYAKQFNKEELEKQIRDNGLQYRYLGNMIGGGNIRFQNSNQNIPLLREFEDNEKFQNGIKILYNFILKQKKIVLMCSEKDPFICHRFFLVSYFLQKKDIEIFHILYDGEIIKNKALENKLNDYVYQKNLLNFEHKDTTIDELYEQHFFHIYKKFSENK